MADQHETAPRGETPEHTKEERIREWLQRNRLATLKDIRESERRMEVIAEELRVQRENKRQKNRRKRRNHREHVRCRLALGHEEVWLTPRKVDPGHMQLALESIRGRRTYHRVRHDLAEGAT
jgi:hypothetical protein